MGTLLYGQVYDLGYSGGIGLGFVDLGFMIWI